MSTRATDNDRLRTGARGLDTIIRGGLVRNAIHVVSGRPGSGS